MWGTAEIPQQHCGRCWGDGCRRCGCCRQDAATPRRTPGSSLAVKYMKEISPYFKNSAAGPTVSWDPSPAVPQKHSSPVLPPRESRTVPLRMCYVSRKCLPADPEHR